MEYKSEEELFNSLRGAFNVKLRLIKDNYSYIKMIDIWNYLKLNKWIKTKDLSISEMVNDIIDVDFEIVKQKVSYITPVPGGVRPLTIAMLMNNVIKATEEQTRK